MRPALKSLAVLILLLGSSIIPLVLASATEESSFPRDSSSPVQRDLGSISTPSSSYPEDSVYEVAAASVPTTGAQTDNPELIYVSDDGYDVFRPYNPHIMTDRTILEGAFGT